MTLSETAEIVRKWLVEFHFNVRNNVNNTRITSDHLPVALGRL